MVSIAKESGAKTAETKTIMTQPPKNGIDKKMMARIAANTVPPSPLSEAESTISLKLMLQTKNDRSATMIMAIVEATNKAVRLG